MNRLAETPLDAQSQTRMALAALVAALVQTLASRDESVLERFSANVEKLYRAMENWKSDPIQAMETLRWTHSLLGEMKS